MIAAIRGQIEWRNPDSIVVKVSGLSFTVIVPSSIPDSVLEPGANISLYTYFHFRENTIALYGFLTRNEEELFRVLLSVSGIGPKTALSIVSALKFEDLVRAASTGDAEMLMHIPGIGKKTAGRLLLELKDKLTDSVAGIQMVSEDRSDVVAALTSLGFSAAEAINAVSSIPEVKGITLEEKVKLALKNIHSRS